MLWRTGVILAFIIASIVLAIQIGERLSDAAMQTIAGVLCGIGASIPVSIGLLLALTRERKPGPDGDDPEPRRSARDNIVVMRPQPRRLTPAERRQLSAPHSTIQDVFKIIDQ